MLLAAWYDDWEQWTALAAVAVGAYLLVIWAAALYWTYRDSASRSRDPIMQGIAVLMVLLFNLPGLLLYLIIRPKLTLAERYDRQLEAQALLHEMNDQPSCPACRRKIQSDFVACPFCRTSLRVACETCARALSFGWVVCPYCGAERAAAAAAASSVGQPGPSPRALRPVVRESARDGEPVEPLTKPARPRRASTARYTPPAAPATGSAPDPATEPSP